jgi:tRNA pseudouridine38-40 synthase
VRTSTRTINAVEVREKNGLVLLEFEGDGFLRHQVRIMAGTLVQGALDGRPPEHIEQVLTARNRTAAGRTAPPQGLFLVEVFY